MRNIHKSTPPSFRRRENAAAIVKATPTGALTKSPDRKFPGLHPPLGGATSPSLPTNRRFAFPILALLAALAVGLLFLLPGGLLQAQNSDSIEYAENGMDPVATYTGLDPEGRTVYWSLALPEPFPAPAPRVDGMDLVTTDFEDNDDFMISADGVLTFKFSPNYEMSTSETTDNVYKVVVVASDDALGAGTDPNPIKVDYHKVTVIVTDVDEDGSISLSAQQPQVTVALTGTLTDQDDTNTDDAVTQLQNIKWTWEQGTAMNGPWIVIVGPTDEMYSPVAGVAGKYLRATATYTDKHGDDKTAMAVSAHAVRAVPAGRNSSPVFPGTPPTNREVDENSPLGTAVGKPVTAGDAGDILTYSLSGADDDYFDIDRATGQITVEKTINFETLAGGDGQCDNQNACEVIVTATDPWDLDAGDATDSATTRNVPINVKDVNEAPKIMGGPTKDSKAEGFDSDPSTTDIREFVVATYTATDVDEADTAATIKWSLTGPDAADFKIDRDTENGDVVAELSFKNAPNYEMPADTGMDNMYMVTVVATRRKEAHRHSRRGHHRHQRRRPRHDNLLICTTQGRHSLHRHPDRRRRRHDGER